MDTNLFQKTTPYNLNDQMEEAL